MDSAYHRNIAIPLNDHAHLISSPYYFPYPFTECSPFPEETTDEYCERMKALVKKNRSPAQIGFLKERDMYLESSAFYIPQGMDLTETTI